MVNGLDETLEDIGEGNLLGDRGLIRPPGDLGLIRPPEGPFRKLYKSLNFTRG